MNTVLYKIKLLNETISNLDIELNKLRVKYKSLPSVEREMVKKQAASIKETQEGLRKDVSLYERILKAQENAKKARKAI